jgi:hypothetical protein
MESPISLASVWLNQSSLSSTASSTEGWPTLSTPGEPRASPTSRSPDASSTSTTSTSLPRRFASGVPLWRGRTRLDCARGLSARCQLRCRLLTRGLVPKSSTRSRPSSNCRRRCRARVGSLKGVCVARGRWPLAHFLSGVEPGHGGTSTRQRAGLPLLLVRGCLACRHGFPYRGQAPFWISRCRPRQGSNARSGSLSIFERLLNESDA